MTADSKTCPVVVHGKDIEGCRVVRSIGCCLQSQVSSSRLSLRSLLSDLVFAVLILQSCSPALVLSDHLVSRSSQKPILLIMESAQLFLQVMSLLVFAYVHPPPQTLVLVYILNVCSSHSLLLSTSAVLHRNEYQYLTQQLHFLNILIKLKVIWSNPF